MSDRETMKRNGDPIVPPLDTRINVLNNEGFLILRDVMYQACAPLYHVRAWYCREQIHSPGLPVRLEAHFDETFRVFDTQNRLLSHGGWRWEHVID